MFAPRPQTAHVSRHYSSLNTARKTQNKDKENAGALPSKTPSRVGKGAMLVPNTTRPLGKDGKGKGKEMDDIGPKRLFASTNQSIMSSKSFGNLQTIRHSKTPAKVTQPLKQFTTPLPSASKPRRSRQSLTPLQAPVLDKPQFSTPAPSKGKLWEEGESLESISEGLNELALGPGLGQIGELEEDDCDVEYMPPKSEPLPYLPIGAIDCIADSLKVFRTVPVLWSIQRDEEVEPPVLEKIVFESARDIVDDVDLEEPMFRTKVKPAQAPPPAQAPVSRLTTRKSATLLSSSITRVQPTTSRPPPARTVPRPTPAVPLRAQSRSIPSTTQSRLNPSISRPTSTSIVRSKSTVPSIRTKPAPVIQAPIQEVEEDSFHLKEDLRSLEDPLDFGFENITF